MCNGAQVIPNWLREIEGWTELNAVVYHGNHESRQLLVQHEFYFQDARGKTVSKYRLENKGILPPCLPPCLPPIIYCLLVLTCDVLLGLFRIPHSSFRIPHFLSSCLLSIILFIFYHLTYCRLSCSFSIILLIFYHLAHFPSSCLLSIIAQ